MNSITSSTQYTDSKLNISLKPVKYAFGLILAGCVVMFLILHLGLTWLYGRADETWVRIGVAAVMLIVAVICQRWLFKVGTGKALLTLGYRYAHLRAILAAAIISVVMLAYFPVFTAITDVPVSLKSNWLWILLGIIAVQGLGEETLFRGYVFGNLRKLGISFQRAGFISMAIFAVVHLVLFTQNPFIVGFLGTLVAVTYAFPMAYLYERGNNTIWAPALLHVTSSAVRLVDVPEASYMTVVSVWIAMQIVTPFLVFAFLGNLLKQQDTRERVR